MKGAERSGYNGRGQEEVDITIQPGLPRKDHIYGDAGTFTQPAFLFAGKGVMAHSALNAMDVGVMAGRRTTRMTHSTHSLGRAKPSWSILIVRITGIPSNRVVCAFSTSNEDGLRAVGTGEYDVRKCVWWAAPSVPTPLSKVVLQIHPLARLAATNRRVHEYREAIRKLAQGVKELWWAVKRAASGVARRGRRAKALAGFRVNNLSL